MHKPYKRIAPNAQTAILFVHGILGTPNHFRDLLPLVPEDMSVYNLLLDGHGKGVRDFSRTSMKKWENQVALAVEELAQSHCHIYIVGHSMGCLLALEQAVIHPKVSKLFLLDAPLKIRVRPVMLRNVLRMYFGYTDPEDERWTAFTQCYGIERDKHVLRYLGWIRRYLELFAKIRKIRKGIPQVKTPCIAYQSALDELVSPKAAVILEKNPDIRVHTLAHSGHFFYEKADEALLERGFLNFIAK